MLPYAMIVSSVRKSRSLYFSFPDSVTVLGVTPDRHVTMKTHVSNLVRSANVELRRISSIRRILPTDATKTLSLPLFFHVLIIATLSFLAVLSIS